MAGVNELWNPSPCRSGEGVNTLEAYKCASCGDGYQSRNGRYIGEMLRRPLGNTVDPCGKGLLAPCKPLKEQVHRQHPSSMGSQPTWQGCSALLAWVAGTVLSILPCHVALCCVTQTWMNALWKGLVLMDGVSPWTAPSSLPATRATRWHLMGIAAKVLGSSRSRPSELSYTQSRGFPRLFPSTWLCLSPGCHVGWFSQHICLWSCLVHIIPTYPSLPHVFMQTSTSASPRPPVPLDSASTLRAPTPAWFVTPATLSPEMAACVKVYQGPRIGCWKE